MTGKYRLKDDVKWNNIIREISNNDFEVIDYLSGFCETFAKALKEKYETYAVHYVSSRGLKPSHIFLKSIKSNKTVYIDIRGITDDLKLFCDSEIFGFEPRDVYNSVEYTFENVIFDEYAEEAYLNAKKIVEKRNKDFDVNQI